MHDFFFVGGTENLWGAPPPQPPPPPVATPLVPSRFTTFVYNIYYTVYMYILYFKILYIPIIIIITVWIFASSLISFNFNFVLMMISKSIYTIHNYFNLSLVCVCLFLYNYKNSRLVSFPLRIQFVACYYLISMFSQLSNLIYFIFLIWFNSI